MYALRGGTRKADQRGILNNSDAWLLGRTNGSAKSRSVMTLDWVCPVGRAGHEGYTGLLGETLTSETLQSMTKSIAAEPTVKGYVHQLRSFPALFAVNLVWHVMRGMWGRPSVKANNAEPRRTPPRVWGRRFGAATAIDGAGNTPVTHMEELHA